MKTETIIIGAGVALGIGLLLGRWATDRKWSDAYYLAIAGKTQVVQDAKAAAAAMCARHDAAIKAEAARVEAARHEVEVATAAAAGIRIRTAAELRAARAAAATVEGERDLLAGEVEARGEKIAALNQVTISQAATIAGLDQEVVTLTRSLEEQRTLTAEVTGQLQAAIAKALKAHSRDDSLWCVYVGGGESVGVDLIARPSLQIGVGLNVRAALRKMFRIGDL